MSRDLAHDERPIEDLAQLCEYFASAAKPDAARGVGTEHEKFGFDAQTLEPLPFEGSRGISALLERMADTFGWQRAYDGGHLLALERDGAAITLEPGGQLELSGRVTRHIGETDEELRNHLDEVRHVGDQLGQVWTHLAMNPWEDIDQTPWMPKPRYGVMRRYLPTRGSLAPWMMKMTATVQANFDYRSEQDAMDILRVGALISPLVTALFANSPYWHGRRSEWITTRMHIWTDTDPDRCGTPLFFLDPGASFADYVEYALDVPLFFIKREGRLVDLSGRSFRELLEGRIDGHTATIGDWELHLSTAFPDVRLKRYIEVRCADAGSRDYLLALPALWKGILYDDQARAEALAAADCESHEGLLELYEQARTLGLDGEWRGATLRERATRLVAIAGEGLNRQAAGATSERPYLDVLLDERGVAHAPAEGLIRLWSETSGERRRIIEASRI